MSASRFSCLPDDDAADSKVLKQLEKQKKDDKKNENKSNKTKTKSDAKELQSIAFGGGSGKKKNKKKNASKNNSNNNNNNDGIKEESPSQLDEWTERDKALTEDNFTAAMQEAILQSQLEFEQQQSATAAQQQLITTGVGSAEVLASLSKEDRKKVLKQQNKPKTMSLDQFNSKPENGTQEESSSKESKLYRHPRHKDRAGGARDSPEKETKQKGDFFNQVDTATMMALNREQILESYKKPDLTTSAGVDAALLAGYREKLITTEKQLAEARAEILDLNTKLTESKSRTKKLTEILLSGEMKEKTEVLVQVHKLEKVREELSSSLTAGRQQLEQQRSLISAVEEEVKRTAAASNNRGVEMELCSRIMNIIKNSKK